MAEITCATCGEPWDTYGVHTGEGDLSVQEYKKLLNGEGCPSCDGKPLCQDCFRPASAHGGGDNDCPEYIPDPRAFDNDFINSLADNGEAYEDWEKMSRAEIDYSGWGSMVAWDYDDIDVENGWNTVSRVVTDDDEGEDDEDDDLRILKQDHQGHDDQELAMHEQEH